MTAESMASRFRRLLKKTNEFMNKFNDSRNEGHFNLLFHNCADFSRTLLNVYYPHSVHRNFFVDLGITTPKQVARSLTKYADHHPELTFSTFMIPQVPGSIKRSHPIDGVMESVVKSKKYVLPLAVLTPEVAAGLVVAYLTDGRFKAPKDATVEIVPGEPATRTADAIPGRFRPHRRRSLRRLQERLQRRFRDPLRRGVLCRCRRLRNSAGTFINRPSGSRRRPSRASLLQPAGNAASAS